MKPRLRALLCFVLLAGMAVSQTATVKRNVNLRPDPSTDNDPIKKLLPGTELELLDPDSTGVFFHVQVDDHTGWVWGKNIQITPTGTPNTPSSSSGTATENPATAISPDWDKPAPQVSFFHSDEGDCGETGSGADRDTDTNRRKNRVDVPASYRLVSWDAINTLDFPQGAPKNRLNWTQSQLDRITPVEGVALSVEGFLYKVKVESSSPTAATGGESTNCHARLANDVDWHMPLTAQVGEEQDVAIVVETTPRVRRSHPNWTTTRLKPWTAHLGNQPNLNYNHEKVRISGWLMLDPEHQDMINGGLRSTLWEIHPITKIERFGTPDNG